MNKREVILILAFLLVVSAAICGGVLAYQKDCANILLEEDMRALVAQSDRMIERKDLNAKRLEKQLSDLKDELNFTKRRSAEREKEFAALNQKHSELAQENQRNIESIAFVRKCADSSHYNTAEQLLGLPACTLTETHNEVCSVGFRDSQGRDFYIGGPGASKEVAGFINSLEDGKTYSMPAAFIEYQKKNSSKTATNP